MREQARALFQFALAEASIPKAFERHIHYSRGVLRVAEDLYDLGAYSRTLVLSLGKAGHTMAEALAEQLGAAANGIVAAPGEISAQVPGFRYFRGGHPTPNPESLRAADAMLKALGNCGERALVIFLLSGGGSSIVERPIDEAITLDDLVATYRALVLSGAPIAEINAIRKHLSAVKGGRLARAAAAAQQLSILVPDVPMTALDALASGPTMPDSTTVEDCYRIAGQYELLPQFPASVRALFESRGLEETPKQDDPAFHRARWWPILSNETAEKAAAAKASLSGFAVEVDNSCDDQDYARAADYLLEKVREQRERVGQACLISGGEVTVSVPQESGRGGRNQHFALYCAQKTAGENLLVLSAGTDGRAGPGCRGGARALRCLSFLPIFR
jgi:hydroxypyruvate reductase